MSRPRHEGAALTCPVCGGAFVAAGRQRYCSPACRQAAWRRRQPTLPSDLLTQPSVGRRTAMMVYECPACEARLAGQQRCPDCQLFARRLSLGGLCPHCDEPVTLADLGLDEPQSRPAAARGVMMA